MEQMRNGVEMEYLPCGVPPSEYSLFYYNNFTDYSQLFELDLDLKTLSKEKMMDSIAKYKTMFKVKLNIHVTDSDDQKEKLS